MRDGVRVNYRDSGGDGPVVVCAHGFFMDSTMFGVLETHLSRQGWRVLSVDARGHGETTVSDPDAPFTYDDLAADLSAVMDDAGVDSAVLVGMSQGGYSALRVALAEPARVRALVLMDTESEASNAEQRAGYEELFAAWCDESIPLEPIARQLAGGLIGGSEQDREPWITKWLKSDRPAIRRAADCLIHRTDVTAELPRITCPALVLRGEFDETSTERKCAVLVEGLPNARPQVTIEGAGHGACVTHSDAVNAAVGDFLSTLG